MQQKPNTAGHREMLIDAAEAHAEGCEATSGSAADRPPQKPQVTFVIPLYNEAESFPRLIERIDGVLEGQAHLAFEVVLVDDGSRDRTPVLMQQLALLDERYHCLFLSRNYGHQAAISAGLSAAEGTEAVMIMDGDLQDPPELFSALYAHLERGYDVVYAVRKGRKEGLLKRAAYYLYYRLMKQITYVDLPLDAGDFSLISRRVVDVINKMPEESRYLRGLRSWVGFRQIGVAYERSEREAGRSKYTAKMLFRLAYDGIFNFSEMPIKFITRLGLATFLMALSYLTLTLVKKIFWGIPEGFAGLLSVLVLLSGVQLISLGVIGEYVLRIFFQVKERPLFIVKQRIKDREFVDG